MIRWFEGFEHFGVIEARMLDGLWSEATGTITEEHPRTGTYAYAMGPSSRLRRALGATATVAAIGIAWRLPASPEAQGAFTISQFRNAAGKAHISVQVGTDLKLKVMGGGLDGDGTTEDAVQIAESTRTLNTNSAPMIESKVFIDVLGSVEVRVNGKVWINVVGIDTRLASSGLANVTEVCAGCFDTLAAPSFSGTWIVDDIFVWDDDDGGADLNVDFFGPKAGVWYFPVSSDQTPMQYAGSVPGLDVFENMDEITPNDGDYSFCSIVGGEGVFGVTPYPVDVRGVYAIAPIARIVVHDDSGIRFGLSVNGDVVTTDIDLTSLDQTYVYGVFEKAPNLDRFSITEQPYIYIERTL